MVTVEPFFTNPPEMSCAITFPAFGLGGGGQGELVGTGAGVGFGLFGSTGGNAVQVFAGVGASTYFTLTIQPSP